MEIQWQQAVRFAIFTGFLALSTARAQESARFENLQLLTTREVVLQFQAPPGLHYRIETSTNLPHWNPFLTLLSTGANHHVDGGAPYLDFRFYRAVALAPTNLLTGDHLVTGDGDVIFHPINHATFLMKWKDKMIYNDPVGGSTPFAAFPKADLILISHSHGDHFHTTTIEAVRSASTMIIAPLAVYNSSGFAALRPLTTVLTNGQTAEIMGMSIEAVPAYNLTVNNHPRGAGNGYILGIGGKRIYIAGDTEDIPEMRGLREIDAAFVPMNVPYTMNVDKAVSAVREFRPKVVYPYHYRNQNGTFADLDGFKKQVGTDLGVEVRLRKWY
jgi:L-ascorbate metabolism protein UlaG (beta-lactamase superfamily)